MSDFRDSETENDCEAVACALYPQIAEALNWLRKFGPARMTGTGSSVFAPFESLIDAKRVLETLPTNISGFVAEGMNSVNVDFN
jgi:4-diphosphocytidyl-2-C-methyl-D-erythritol kinase